MPEHKFMTAEECNCDKPHCPICEGGLALCKVCQCGEGELPSECPGYPCSRTHGDRIYAGEIDFRDGQWVNLPSKNSPASLKERTHEH